MTASISVEWLQFYFDSSREVLEADAWLAKMSCSVLTFRACEPGWLMIDPFR